MLCNQANNRPLSANHVLEKNRDKSLAKEGGEMMEMGGMDGENEC